MIDLDTKSVCDFYFSGLHVIYFENESKFALEFKYVCID